MIRVSQSSQFWDGGGWGLLFIFPGLLISLFIVYRIKGLNLLTIDVLNIETFRKTKFLLSERCLLFSLSVGDALSVSGKQDSYLK